jgi:hypothetical protein
MARQILQNVIKEARIIRPLLQQVFVICNIISTSCKRTAQVIHDSAIDTTTNIRQSSLPDEVFSEPGLATRHLQEINL